MMTIFATAVLTAALLGAPGVLIMDADTGGIDLLAWGDYEYNVYISHDVTHCLWYPPHSVQVLTETSFYKKTFEWGDYGLDDPGGGDQACIWWDTHPEPSAVYFGIRRRNVIERLYLPTVIR